MTFSQKALPQEHNSYLYSLFCRWVTASLSRFKSSGHGGHMGWVQTPPDPSCLDKLHKGLPDSSLASAAGSHYRQSESAWGGAILHPSSTHLFVYTDHASVVISILLARGWYTRAQFCTFHNHGFMLLLFLCLAICRVTGKTLGQSHQQPFSFSAQPLNLNYTREFLPKY